MCLRQRAARERQGGGKGGKKNKFKNSSVFLLPSKLEGGGGLKRSLFYFDDEEKINTKYSPLFSVSKNKKDIVSRKPFYKNRNRLSAISPVYRSFFLK